MLAQDNAPAGPLLDLTAIREIAVDPVHLATQSIVGFNSSDARARPFQLLRTQLLKRMAERKMRLVGITSAAPEAGKSFLALNLAAALSQLPDTPVILVDLDLRQASIAEELGIPTDVGLAEYLAGDVHDLTGIAYRVEGTSLVVIPTSAADGVASEMLAGRAATSLLAALRGAAESAIVIFDLPPVFADDDAMIVAQKLDGYLLVADSGKTSGRQVEDCIAMLQPTPCLGAILNRYEGGLARSYGYGYGYGERGRQ